MPILMGHGINAVKALPSVHTLIANMKGSILAVYRDVIHKWLALYLAKFSYRFSRRFGESQMLDRILTACFCTRAVPYSELIA